MLSEELQQKLSVQGKRFRNLGSPVKILLGVVAALIVAAIAFWLFNQIFYYYIARSYAEELADAYDLNRGFTSAVVWASFAAVVVFAGLAFSFSRRKRWAGSAGIVALLIGHSIAIGNVTRNFERQGSSARCYVLTRDSVKILNRLGVDPETGRECRPLTAAMVERIDLYKTGKRPLLITQNDPSFFSPLSGEPIVWFAKRSDGRIELYDLMGFHPETGEELQPVTKDIAVLWKIQNEKVVKRAPSRIDPEKYPLFDPVNGRARVWFWRDEAGNYEFYDGPGFQPRTGESLQVISKESISAWRDSIAAAAAKRRSEQELKEKEARERASRDEQERRDRAEATRAAAQAEAEAAQKQMQSANDCDLLAANPTDVRKTAEGVPFETLKFQADRAFEACTQAVRIFPNELRYQYQLGRAAQFKDKRAAFAILTTLVNAKYPAAFDNLGGIYLYERKDIPKAFQLFRIGSSLGDTDSMVSLADLYDRGLVGASDPYSAKWELLNKAAGLGHAGAQRAIAAERDRVQKAANDLQMQQEGARNAAALFGVILQNVGRR
jgi:hypothetical protein